MQRHLIVMRHAKSSWDSAAASDYERPLNHRGNRDTPRVARRIAELGWQPQHVLCSDAQRTRETCSLLLAQWDSGIGVDYLMSLYLGGPRELANELPAVSEEVETLLVIGHNPGLEMVVHQLLGQSVTMKTATAALMRSDACPAWSDAFRRDWQLETVIYPRALDARLPDT